MPDRRQHRSAAPQDPRDFCPEAIERMRAAVEHLSWLAERGYAPVAALKLVGDRFALTARQRHAVQRCACGDSQRMGRARKRRGLAGLSGERVAIDGFNVLITLETALGGGVVLRARDGCYRDLANLRGTWRKVHETEPALALLGAALARARIAEAHVLLDARVSNSGRLAGMLRELGQSWPFALGCEAVGGVDAKLKRSSDPVASADSVILDACASWVNLAREVVQGDVPQAWLVDLARRAG